MSKNLKMKLFSLIIFFEIISIVVGLRCAHSCAFGPVQFGSTDPIRTPCQTKEIDEEKTMCSVLFNIDFSRSTISGRLNEQVRSTSQSSSLLLSHTMNPSRTILFITFACSTNDHCDEEFVNQTVSSSSWVTINETEFRNGMAILLFRNPSATEDVRCENKLVCRPDEECHGLFSTNRSKSFDVSTKFDNHFPCDNTTTNGEILFKQHFYTSVDQSEEILEVFCSQNQCNDRETIERVYNLFKKDFLLPLNYSSYTYVPPPPTSGFKGLHLDSILWISFFLSIYSKFHL